jgi:ABC-2 type transport system permease protein
VSARAPHQDHPPHLRPAATGFSLQRVGAMILRYGYLLRSSPPRLIELAYWPTLQIITWGFVSQFLGSHGGPVGGTFGVLMAGALLWDVMFRGQLGVAMSFFEEMWSRNLGHLLATPLKPLEFITALLTMSLVRTVIGLAPASLLALWFFDFSIYSMGLTLVGLFFLLIAMGWAIGLFVSGLVMRYGLGAEGLAWSVIFALAPVSGVYYPLSVLPGWLQPLALILPSAHAFEGMRMVIATHVVPWRHLVIGGALDLVYLAIGIAAFLAYHAAARRNGRLLAMGE